MNTDAEKVMYTIHKHSMTPLKDGRKGDCCGIKFETISDGYYCTQCDFFAHKTCRNTPTEIPHPSSKRCGRKSMYLIYNDRSGYPRCGVCSGKIESTIQSYKCYTCNLEVHLECAKYPPPEIIDVPRHHDHQLKLDMVESCFSSFTCAACGKDAAGYSYKCHECPMAFHVNCEKYPAEINHPFHPLHPLRLFWGEPPEYSGTCCYCEEKLSNSQYFYHCSTCNFSLDMHCALHPPPQYLDDPNTHDHKLTLLPRLVSFTCDICGLSGDRSPYVCLECDFMAHNTCSGFPWVININRHDHRVSRTSLLGVVNSVCGVCQKKMDWSCGGYYCKRCPESVYHTKCATRDDVSDRREMKDVPEKDEDVEPFEVIDENTIRHFLHHAFGHHLRLDNCGIFIEERGSCKACAYPINHDSSYSCMGKNCDFILHESCAKMPMQKQLLLRHGTFFLNQVTRHCSICEACGICYNGFNYTESGRGIDVRCASISEPFVHQSHPHPLFYTTPKGVCSACNKENNYVLKCVEDNCGYILDFKCALLPYEVKHRVDDHFLSLCYGENASGKYQCNICEKETDPRTWFYTCKDCEVTLHINCVLGDFRAIEAERKLTTWEQHCLTSMAVHNNTMPQPLCNQCKSCCVFPIILKVTEDQMPDKNYPKYYCSINCFDLKYIGTGWYAYSIFRA